MNNNWKYANNQNQTWPEFRSVQGLDPIRRETWGNGGLRTWRRQATTTLPNSPKIKIFNFSFSNFYFWNSFLIFLITLYSLIIIIPPSTATVRQRRRRVGVSTFWWSSSHVNMVYPNQRLLTSQQIQRSRSCLLNQCKICGSNGRWLQ